MKYFEKNKLTLRTLLLVLVLSLSLTGCHFPVPPTAGEEPTQENKPTQENEPTQEDAIISSGDIAPPIWMMAYVPNQYLEYDTDLEVIFLYYPFKGDGLGSAFGGELLNTVVEIKIVAGDGEDGRLEETSTLVRRIEQPSKDMCQSFTIKGYTYHTMLEEIVVPKEMLICPNSWITFSVHAYYTVRVNEEKIVNYEYHCGTCVYYRKLEQNIRLFGSRWDFDDYEEEK